MVPEVDKQDTQALVTRLKETAEATRLEILDWTLPREQTANDAEAQAVRKLAARSAQQARQWLGKMLGELGSVYPYAQGADPGTSLIDPTAVKQDDTYAGMEKTTLIRRVKYGRQVLNFLRVELEDMVPQLIPGSSFNRYLFLVQEHLSQAAMWLGELLHEFHDAHNALRNPEQEAAKSSAPAQDGLAMEVPEFAEVLAPNGNVIRKTLVKPARK